MDEHSQVSPPEEDLEALLGSDIDEAAALNELNTSIQDNSVNLLATETSMLHQLFDEGDNVLFEPSSESFPP